MKRLLIGIVTIILICAVAYYFFGAWGLVILFAGVLIFMWYCWYLLATMITESFESERTYKEPEDNVEMHKELDLPERFFQMDFLATAN